MDILGYNTRLSPRQLEEMGQTSLPLADGSGDHWGIMNSFHNLHCLVRGRCLLQWSKLTSWQNKIREALAPEYYGINKTKHTIDGHVYAPHISAHLFTPNSYRNATTDPITSNSTLHWEHSSLYHVPCRCHNVDLVLARRRASATGKIFPSNKL